MSSSLLCIYLTIFLLLFSAPYLRETFINDIYSSGDGPDSDLRRRPEIGENTYHRNYTSLVDYYKGTFVQFGWPGIHDKQTQGVCEEDRMIAYQFIAFPG